MHLTSSPCIGNSLGGSSALSVPFIITVRISPVATKSLHRVPAPFTPVPAKPASDYSRFAPPTARVIGGFEYVFQITKLQPGVHSSSAPLYLPALFYFNKAFAVTLNTRELLPQHLTVVCIHCPSTDTVGLLPSFCYLRQDTHSTFAIGGVSCSAVTFVVAGNLLLRINICAKMPAHRKSAKRYMPVRRTKQKKCFI
jgi:hypothetical protein